MSIHGAKNLVEKSKKNVVVIDGKEYYSALHVMDKTYVPPYNGEDMQKVAPKYKSQAYFEALEQQKKEEAAKSATPSHIIVEKNGKEYEKFCKSDWFRTQEVRLHQQFQRPVRTAESSSSGNRKDPETLRGGYHCRLFGSNQP